MKTVEIDDFADFRQPAIVQITDKILATFCQTTRSCKLSNEIYQNVIGTMVIHSVSAIFGKTTRVSLLNFVKSVNFVQNLVKSAIFVAAYI